LYDRRGVRKSEPVFVPGQ